jgi:nitroreductase
MLAKWDNWIETQYCSLMQAHLIVVVKTYPKHQEWEEALMAASALIQNIQLLAWERKIGTVWKTHDYNWDARFHRAIGVKADERIAGTLHLGYFDKVPKAKPRTAVTKLLTCFGDQPQ